MYDDLKYGKCVYVKCVYIMLNYATILKIKINKKNPAFNDAAQKE